MSDLLHRLRVSAQPVGTLLLEAADALQASQTRIAELTETLRGLVEIGNSERSREFADVKKTLAKARALLSEGSVVAAGPAALAAVPFQAQNGHDGTSSSSNAEESPPRAAEPNARDEEIVTGMYKEIQSLLRYSV
jgi:hypothetical protein